MRSDFADPPGEGRYRGRGDGPYSTGASDLVGEEDNIRQKMLRAAGLFSEAQVYWRHSDLRIFAPAV